MQIYLKLIITAALATFSATFIIYFTQFNGELSKSISDWGSFGSYIGGTLSAIFGLLSLLALFHTIKIQTQQINEASLNALKSLELQSESYKNQLIAARISALTSQAETLKVFIEIDGSSYKETTANSTSLGSINSKDYIKLTKRQALAKLSNIYIELEKINLPGNY